MVAGPLTGGALHVEVTEGDAVEVLVGPGTRFTTSEGRVDISELQGRLRVRIPSAQTSATVEVAGAVYLRKNGKRKAEADTGPIY